MRWVNILDDPAIPSKLKESMPTKCNYCGKPLLVGHNDFGRMTGLKCSDDNCLSMLACRLEFIYNLLGVKGFGFAKCYELMRSNNFTHPMQALGLFESKPTVSLGTFLRMNCIQGIDNEWVTMAEKADAYTLDEFLKAYPTCTELVSNLDLIRENLKYVNLTERRFNIKGVSPIITIMITGCPIGFQTKEHFINSCNEFLKGEFKVIHQATARQSGVDFLIREPGSTTRNKVAVAMKAGIPIVTSKEFLSFLNSLMEEVNKRDNS